MRGQNYYQDLGYWKRGREHGKVRGGMEEE
jgi:hypothetical protein